MFPLVSLFPLGCGSLSCPLPLLNRRDLTIQCPIWFGVGKARAVYIPLACFLLLKIMFLNILWEIGISGTREMIFLANVFLAHTPNKKPNLSHFVHNAKQSKRLNHKQLVRFFTEPMAGANRSYNPGDVSCDRWNLITPDLLPRFSP